MPSIQKQNKTLIVTTPADLLDTDWRNLENGLLRRVRHERIRVVIIDVTAMYTMDSYATRLLSGIARAIELLGAQAIVVGIQPDVAFAMSQLGLRLNTFLALDLDEGLEKAGELGGRI